MSNMKKQNHSFKNDIVPIFTKTTSRPMIECNACSVRTGGQFPFTLPLIFLFFVVLLYQSTLCNTLYWYDSAELTVAADMLGISHPTGYPTYMHLAKYISLFTPKDPIRGVHMLSLLCSILTLYYLVMFLERLRIGWEGITIAILFCAISPVYWSSSRVAEVYTLNALFLMLILNSELLWRASNDKRYAFFSSFVFGLGLGNHVTLSFVGPIMLFYRFKLSKLSYNRVESKNQRLIFLFSNAFFFILGLSVYLYLPLRANTNPIFNIGDPDSLEEFFHVLSGGDFYHYFLSEQKVNFLTLILKPVKILIVQFTIGGIILFLIGIWKSIRKPISGFLFSYFILLFFFVMFYGVQDIEDFTLPLIVIGSIWIGIGTDFIMKFKANKQALTLSWKQISIRRAAILLLLIVLIIRAFLLRPELSLHNYLDTEEYVQRVNHILPSNALIINKMNPEDWRLIAPLWYSRYCRKKRLDLTMFDDMGFWKTQLSTPPRNSFVLHYDISLLGKYKMIPYGTVWKLKARKYNFPPKNLTPIIINMQSFNNADYRHDPFSPNPELGDPQYFPHLEPGIHYWRNYPFKIMLPYEETFVPSVLTTCFMHNFKVSIPLKKVPTKSILLIIDGGIQKHRYVRCARLKVNFLDGKSLQKDIYSFKDVWEYFNYKNDYPVPIELCAYGEMENVSLSVLPIIIPKEKTPVSLTIESGASSPKEEWYPGITVFAITQLIAEHNESFRTKKDTNLSNQNQNQNQNKYFYLNLKPYANSDYRHSLLMPNPEIGKSTFPDLKEGLLYYKAVPFHILLPYEIAFQPSVITLRSDFNPQLSIPVKKISTDSFMIALNAYDINYSNNSPGSVSVFYKDGKPTYIPLLPGENIWDNKLLNNVNIDIGKLLWGPVGNQSIALLKIKCNNQKIPESLLISLNSKDSVKPVLAIFAITQIFTQNEKGNFVFTNI